MSEPELCPDRNKVGAGLGVRTVTRERLARPVRRDCTCALAFFIVCLTGSCAGRTDAPFLHSSSSRQYVTASVPIYRFFRSGGNPARRFRTVRSACPCNVSLTGSGVMRLRRSPTPAGRILCLVCGDFSAPIPLSFRHAIPHGVPVFPDLSVY